MKPMNLGEMILENQVEVTHGQRFCRTYTLYLQTKEAYALNPNCDVKVATDKGFIDGRQFMKEFEAR